MSAPCRDFPGVPIVDTQGDAIPADVTSLFGPPGFGSTAGGPCLVEPVDASLFPKNWVRPRIAWIAPSDQVVFEVRVHSDVDGGLPVATPCVQQPSYADFSGPPQPCLPGGAPGDGSWGAPDDTLIAYDRVAAGTSMYDQPLAEIYVVPYGAVSTPVTASFSPPACSHPPAADTLVFSSLRNALAASRAQIYVAGVVVYPDGSIQAYAPIHAWNQGAALTNILPSWENYDIQPGVTTDNPPTEVP